MSLSRKNRGVAAVLATALIGAFAGPGDGHAGRRRDVAGGRPPGRRASPPTRCPPCRSTAWSGRRPSSATPSTPAAVRQRPPGRRGGRARTRPRAATCSPTTSRPASSITSFAPSLNAQVKAVAASPDGSRVYVGGVLHQRRRAAALPARGLRHRDRRADLQLRAEPRRRGQRHRRHQHHRLRRRRVRGRRTASPRDHLAAFSAAPARCSAGPPAPTTSSTRWSLTPDGTRSSSAARSRTSTALSALGLGCARRHDRRPRAVRGEPGRQGLRRAARDPVAAHRRHGHLRHRLRLRRHRATSRASFSADPVNRRHQLAGRLPRRHLRRLPGRHASTSSATSTTASNIGGFPDTSPRATGTARRRSPRTRPAQCCTTASRRRLRQLRRPAQPVAAQLVPRPGRRHLHRAGPGGLDGHRQRQLRRLGGEFPTVNGVAQQGLVRFAVPSLAPNKLGPQDTGAGLRHRRSPRRSPRCARSAGWPTTTGTTRT